MKKPLIVAIIWVLAVLLVAGTQAIKEAEANFLPREKPTNPPPITINSPLNTTYQQNDILLNFTIVGISSWWPGSYHLTDLYYEIDGQSTSLYDANSSFLQNTEQYATSIFGLSAGEHTLTIHAPAAGSYYTNYPEPDTAPYSMESIQTVRFTVDIKTENTSPPTQAPTQNPAALPLATQNALATSTPSSTPPLTPYLTPSASPTQQPTLEAASTPLASPMAPEFPSILALTFLMVAILSGTILYKKKSRTKR